MDRNEEDQSVLVDEREEGVYVSKGDFMKTARLWLGTIEALHSLLAGNGYKRFGKQQGSDIGGTYERPDK